MIPCETEGGGQAEKTKRGTRGALALVFGALRSTPRRTSVWEQFADLLRSLETRGCRHRLEEQGRSVDAGLSKLAHETANAKLARAKGREREGEFQRNNDRHGVERRGLWGGGAFASVDSPARSGHPFRYWRHGGAILSNVRGCTAIRGMGDNYSKRERKANNGQRKGCRGRETGTNSEREQKAGREQPQLVFGSLTLHRVRLQRRST